MTEQIRALVEPKLLIWGRESIGYAIEEAARKIGVDPERLASWEAGELSPTVLQLKKAAWVYRRPFAAFYLSEVPDDVDLSVRDFRRPPEGVPRPPSPQLRLQLRKSLHRREIALELSQVLGEELVPFASSASTSEPPGPLAERLRSLLGVTLEEQFRWRSEYDALRAWKQATEALGLLVFEVEDVALQELRGFSISEEILPIAGLNSKDAPRGRIFTLMHELVHVLLRNAGLCGYFGRERAGSSEERIEDFSNRVAASILVPEDALLRERAVVGHGRSPYWTDDELYGLVLRYQVSEEVIVRRLVAVELASREFYNTKRQHYERLYRKLKTARGGRGPSIRDKTIRNNGLAFVALLLDALNQEAVTSSDVADYLEVRLRHLPSIAEAIAKRQRTASLES